MSRPTVAVLDYGSGNLHSVTRALAAAGAEVSLSADAEVCGRAAGLVVPGVGAFAACMAGLSAVGGPAIIRRRFAEAAPMFGICVGHQVMFTEGVEHGRTAAGVGLLPGTVAELRVARLPHMGWNTVVPHPDSGLLHGPTEERFYFVHSYGVHDQPDWPEGARPTWAEHQGDRFVAAIEYDALTSTQFHPEKSGHAGAQLLSRWVDGLR
ncbi:MAG: imidazole glycerol phosphate synthase subunit HisH [Propioniciclava sp.]